MLPPTERRRPLFPGKHRMALSQRGLELEIQELIAGVCRQDNQQTNTKRQGHCLDWRRDSEFTPERLPVFLQSFAQDKKTHQPGHKEESTDAPAGEFERYGGEIVQGRGKRGRAEKDPGHGH